MLKSLAQGSLIFGRKVAREMTKGSNFEKNPTGFWTGKGPDVDIQRKTMAGFTAVGIAVASLIAVTPESSTPIPKAPFA